MPCPPRDRSTMKKKPPSPQAEEDHDLEILKAVAQAWHSRSGRSKTTKESDAHHQSHKTKPPTRFLLEALNNKPLPAKWDFRESLWDSYEIVAVSRRLEAGMVLDDPFKALIHDKNSSRALGRDKESKNSLRNLFNLMSSRRFVEPGDDQHKDKSEF